MNVWQMKLRDKIELLKKRNKEFINEAVKGQDYNHMLVIIDFIIDHLKEISNHVKGNK